MKFAQDYKYRNIPFCSQCAAHTKFIPVQSNRVVGAVTIDNPNTSIDPAYVATRSEIKLVCNTCGSEMFKWAEKSSGTGKYFEQFFTQQEIQKRTDNLAKGCARILAAFLALVTLAVLLQFNVIPNNNYIIIGGPIIMYFLLFPISKMALTIRGVGMCQKRVITVGKGVNGETVLFHQQTGQIEYK